MGFWTNKQHRTAFDDAEDQGNPPAVGPLKMWLVGTGRCVFLLICVPLLAAATAGLTGAEEWDGKTPAMLSPVTAPEESLAGVPLEDWLQRLGDDKLSPEQIASITTQALHRQADDKTKWDRRWGQFVELAQKKGKVPVELWCKYLLAAVQVQVSVATEAKRSEGLPIWIEQRGSRVGSGNPLATGRGRLEADLSGLVLFPGPTAGKKITYEKITLSAVSGSGCGWTQALTNSRFAALQPGPQYLHYRYHIEMFEADVPLGKQAQTKPLGQRTIEGTLPWQLLAETATPSLPALRPDANLRPSVESSFRVQYVLRDEKDTTLVQVMVQVEHPPVGMAFDMSLRNGNDTWPLGPVAWVEGKIRWWAYDTDLPEGITKVDVVLTPSALAGAKLKRQEPHQLMKLHEIYDGPPIVLYRIPVGSQKISMHRISPPTTEAARADAMDQLDQTDPTVQHLKRAGDWAKARADFQRRAEEHPSDALALYNFGCLATADGDLASAMTSFVNARRSNPAASLRRPIQRQLRRLCAMYLDRAEKNELAAMYALGQAYEQGWGVKQEFQEAKRWYRNAANAGHAEAMCRLAAMYEHETGATVQSEKAHQWYQTQAREWYRQAANLGNQEAKQWLTTHDQH